ncbi:MAG: hypothetical protein ACI4PO_05730 [Faecousia sp.]
MKKICQYALAVILVIAIIGGIVTAVCFSSFVKPGVHSFAGYTRLDFQQKVYFVNADSEEVSGSSTLTVSGLVQPEKSDGSAGVFRGSMSVAKYPTALENGYNAFFASASKGTISVNNRNPGTDDAQTGVTYWLLIPQDHPDIFAVYIYLEDGTAITAFPGESEQEAIENCRDYWQWFRTQNAS